MNLYVLGVNIKTTPIEIREKLNFSKAELNDSLHQFKSKACIEECVILSTCNRTEIYIYSGVVALDRHYIEQILCDIKMVDAAEFRKFFYFYFDQSAVHHLFKVAVGLDSMVLGEDQILGQVKEANLSAIEFKASGAILNTLFREAITSAKDIKTNTDMSKIPVSVSSVALRKIYNIFNGLNNCEVLIIGLGQVGILTVNQLKSYGAKKIYVTNRTHGKAEQIAQMYENTEVINYNDRYNYLDRSNIIISSTASPHYTITADTAKKYIVTLKKRVFLDLAVPRDIDEDIKYIHESIYINVDSLNSEIQANQTKRFNEIEKAEKIIDKYIIEFNNWLKNRKRYLGA